MTLAELKKSLQEKETMASQTELVYQQLLGQISLLREMVKIEEQRKEPPKESDKP